MSKPIAISGAMMVCDKGTVMVPLVASGGGGTVSMCGFLAALVSDVAPGANITPFGMCVITKATCAPVPRGHWINPFGNKCIVGKVESLLEGATLPCQVGGTISVMSASQASVVVGRNLAKVTPEALILAWVAHEAATQNPRFKDDVCNQFVVAAFAAAGFLIPKVSRNRTFLKIDPLARDTVPIVQELFDGSRYNDVLTPPKPITEAKAGDMILWNTATDHHAAILTHKHGKKWENWQVTYAGSGGPIIKTGPIGGFTKDKYGIPIARGPRNP